MVNGSIEVEVAVCMFVIVVDVVLAVESIRLRAHNANST